MRTKPNRLSQPIRMHRFLAVCAVFATTTACLAQTTALPLSTVEAASVGSSQFSQISSFVEHWSSRALESDTQQSVRAQTKLIEPLINARVSISFRQTYSDALASYFTELESNGDIASIFAALRVAGELGTSRGNKILLSGLSSTDIGTQIFAAGAAGRTFRTTAANGPAFSANDLNSLITALGSIASSSDDHNLVSACVQALGYGSTLPSNDFREARAGCLQAMCDAASRNLISNNLSDLEMRVRLAMLASGAATNSLLQVSEDSNNDAIKSAVALGADMISIALSDVIDGTMPAVSDRDLHVTLVRSGESLLYFALREHAELMRKNVGTVQQTNFADLLEQGEDRDFRNQAALLLGPGSPIVTDFGFSDDRFVN